MGLKVSTISRLPLDTDRDYFVYFLDYGWEEPFSQALHANFDAFAGGLAGHKGIVIAGLHRQEFADEVLSWHSLNGEPAEQLLPAILISGCHPEEFQVNPHSDPSWKRDHEGIRRHDGALLIPLREICATPDDVVPVITSVLRSIQQGIKVENFQIARRMNDAVHTADMFILQPNVGGLGLDLREVWKICKPYFSKRRPENGD